MKPNENKILQALASHAGKAASAEQLSRDTSIDLGGVLSILETLCEQEYCELDKKEQTTISLTVEGARYAHKGTPEKRLYTAIQKTGGNGIDLQKALADPSLEKQESQIALQWALKKKTISLEKTAGHTIAKASQTTPVFEDDNLLCGIASGTAAQKCPTGNLENLKARKLVEEKVHKTVSAKITGKGKTALSSGTVEQVSQLTPQLLKTGEWKGKSFSPYDLSTVVAPLQVARKHAYKEFLQRMKEKLVGLGFREVRGSLEEIEFWNMDALYMPQGHPARQLHDVFFVRHPKNREDHYRGEIADDKLFEEVFNAHKHGGKTGSSGWRYEMSRDISSRVILRSHDTGISARELFRKLSPPDRVFFIARVFRPDEIDWKHFIEFEQLGGYVAGEDTSFRELLGTLKTFAEEVFKAEAVKFVPSYFPFTEPSTELYAKIPGKGWAEVGGAGLFRPELLSALGIDYPVIAWGLGIGRLAMLTIGTQDVRDLHSHDLQFLQGR